VFDQKATKEEEALTVVHPAYKTYQEEVPKFFPLPGNLNLPWGDNKQ
jgi:protein-S-isoprenylcysteine O-methyltransferase Ste14